VTTLALLLAAASWTSDASVDPRVEQIVDELVEAEGGALLAEAEIAAMLEELDLDPPAGQRGRRRRWLPALVLRVAWSSPSRPRRKSWELVVLLSWPLGG
jgi:hypothetical protein